jgi:hypothetical protein
MDGSLRKVLREGGIRAPRGQNQKNNEREQELLHDNSPIENLIRGDFRLTSRIR